MEPRSPARGRAMGADIEPGQARGCAPEGEAGRRRVVVDFMYLDLSECARCQETERNLDRAVSKVRWLLSETGAEVVANKVHVQTEDQALELGFLSSPTIRVNGRDIQPDVRESLCEACGILCGEECDCRVWVYQGRECLALPEGLMIDAILSAIYRSPEQEVVEPAKRLRELPDNLRRFFAGKARRRRER